MTERGRRNAQEYRNKREEREEERVRWADEMRDRKKLKEEESDRFCNVGEVVKT